MEFIIQYISEVFIRMKIHLESLEEKIDIRFVQLNNSKSFVFNSSHLKLHFQVLIDKIQKAIVLAL